MSNIIIPATGNGTATPNVQTDLVGGNHFQVIKIADGTVGGSAPATVDTGGNLHVAVGTALPGVLVGATVSNFPVTQSISVASVAGTAIQPVSGSVSIVNQLNPQPVSGSVAITGTPTVAIASTSISVGVSVANYPANIGSTSALIASAYPGIEFGASVANFPAVQTVAPAAAATGGASPYHYVSGASVNQNNVKSSAGTVYTLAAMNQNVAPRYLKLFDKSSTPSPGTDIPRQTYMLPGASSGAGAVIPLPVGLLFASGIGFAITGNITDLDATAVGASDVVVNLAYL